MKTFFGTIGMLVVSASVFTSPLAAQNNQSAGLDSASVVMLKPNRFVRIQVPDLGRVSGTVGSLTATELVLRREAQTRTVSLGAIDTLWVRGRHTKRGAILGAVVGVAGGIFLGWVASGLCEYELGHGGECPDNAAGAVFGGLAVGLAGGATGALIGAAIPRWRRVYPH